MYLTDLEQLDVSLSVCLVTTEVPAALVHCGEYLVAAECHDGQRGWQQPQGLPPLHWLIT